MNSSNTEFVVLKILIIGGTRFVGKALVSRLIEKGHDITLFTRGNNPLPSNVHHIRGDRFNKSDLVQLASSKWDVIADTSGRKLVDTQLVLEFAGKPKFRFLYVSSAGVYSDSGYWPIDENSPIDPQSRHIGKADTENWLEDENIPFTSFRPTYIYGPGNYNPIEKWFFDRITLERPIPLPLWGVFITQLGHVFDLAESMSRSLSFESAKNKIYNCSGTKAITLKALVDEFAVVCQKKPSDLDIRSFDPSSLDPKGRKLFPLRISHFQVDTSLIQKELNWQPKFDLKAGLKDSYENDYLISNKDATDFSGDEILIG